MNRPICLIGGLSLAEKWIEEHSKNEDRFYLKDEISMSDIKTFRNFLLESSLRKKIGIIYFFNNLDDSKQSVFLKVFEDLPDFSRVVIHTAHFVSFTIHTRCDPVFLRNQACFTQSQDLQWLLNFFKHELSNKSLTQNKKQGISVYLETLNLMENGFLKEEEKDCILADLRSL